MFKEHMPFLLTLVDFQGLEIIKDLTFYNARKVILDLKDHQVKTVEMEHKDLLVKRGTKEIPEQRYL
jgi:hypothetical protein